MTEHTYPLELLRAELKSAMAEQLVHLVDRFASKQELAAFRGDFTQHQREDEQHFREINDKLDALLTEKDQRDGAEKERRRWLDNRRFAITTIVVLTGALLGSVVTLVWLAVG